MISVLSDDSAQMSQFFARTGCIGASKILVKARYHGQLQLTFLILFEMCPKVLQVLKAGIKCLVRFVILYTLFDQIVLDLHHHLRYMMLKAKPEIIQF